MATQVLAAVQDWIERRMVAMLTGGGTPRARLVRTLDLISEFYDHGSKACVVGHLCASVDRRQFHKPLDRVLRTWMGAIGALLEEAGLSEPRRPGAGRRRGDSDPGSARRQRRTRRPGAVSARDQAAGDATCSKARRLEAGLGRDRLAGRARRLA